MVWGSDASSRLPTIRWNWFKKSRDAGMSSEDGVNRDSSSVGCCCRERNPISPAQVEEAFAISQWQQVPHWAFVSFRCLAALYFTTWLITSWVSFKDTHKGGFSKWFVFITNWSFTLLVLQACALAWPVLKKKTIRRGEHLVTMEPIMSKEVAVEGGQYEDDEENEGKRLSLLHQMMWAFDNIASTFAIGVTIVFWIFLYNRQQPPSVVTVHTHGINAVYVLVDQILSRRPRRLIHCYQPIVFGLVYVLFSVIYWRLGGTDPMGRHFVYPFLDWEKPVKTLIFAFAFAVICVVMIYFVLYGVYRLRTFVHRKIVLAKSRRKEYPPCKTSIVI